MRLPELYKTTAFRLALRYLLVYALLLGTALALFALVTNLLVSAKIRDDLKQSLSTIEREFDREGIAGAQLAVKRLLEAEEGGDRFVLLIDAEERIVGGNLLRWPAESGIALDGKLENVWIEANHLPVSVDDDEVYWPVIATALSDGSRLLLSHSVEQVETLNELVELLVEVLGAAILLSVVMSIAIGRAILRRIDVVSDTTAEIMAGDLSRRIEVSSRNDEFDTLACRLNAMLDKIQALVGSMRDVTDNVAHDLRSPLTRLRNHLEITLLEPREVDEYREVIGKAVEDAEALINTFNSLLKIAQVESGNHREEWSHFDLGALVKDLVNIYRPLAEESRRCLYTRGIARYPVFGNRDLLAQALSNLLDNALKYTAADGEVLLALEGFENWIELRVVDNGPGIPASEHERVFERFTRLEGSRNLPGNGLGLSLVKATCQLHKASIELRDADPGLAVIIRFPRPVSKK
ncbi:MAG: HAMP domain-containing protein [Gammaproteobacteria bacterium]|nr:HAMP domain-containing protein [Gammaproteobacteria bacterium]